MSLDMHYEDKVRAGGPDVSNIFTEQHRQSLLKVFIQVMMLVVLVCATLIYSCF